MTLFVINMQFTGRNTSINVWQFVEFSNSKNDSASTVIIVITILTLKMEASSSSQTSVYFYKCTPIHTHEVSYTVCHFCDRISPHKYKRYKLKPSRIKQHKIEQYKKFHFISLRKQYQLTRMKAAFSCSIILASQVPGTKLCRGFIK